MIESANEDFEIDMDRSWMIGDKKIDVETAQNADIRSALVLTGYGEQHRALLSRQPDLISKNLGEASLSILAY